MSARREQTGEDTFANGFPIGALPLSPVRAGRVSDGSLSVAADRGGEEEGTIADASGSDSPEPMPLTDGQTTTDRATPSGVWDYFVLFAVTPSQSSVRN